MLPAVLAGAIREKNGSRAASTVFDVSQVNLTMTAGPDVTKVDELAR